MHPLIGCVLFIAFDRLANIYLNGGCLKIHPYFLNKLIIIHLYIICLMKTTTQPNGKKKQAWNAVKWIVGVFLILGGIGFLGKSFIAGLLIL